jgi:hypothetical protein
MAVAVKRLDIEIGDVVEIAGKRYDVVSDKAGGIALEPVITLTSRELHERRGTRPARRNEFARLFGDLPHEAGSRARSLSEHSGGTRARPCKNHRKEKS